MGKPPVCRGFSFGAPPVPPGTALLIDEALNQNYNRLPSEK
jgi:hypothetical protein